MHYFTRSGWFRLSNSNPHADAHILVVCSRHDVQRHTLYSVYITGPAASHVNEHICRVVNIVKPPSPFRKLYLTTNLWPTFSGLMTISTGEEFQWIQGDGKGRGTIIVGGGSLRVVQIINPKWTETTGFSVPFAPGQQLAWVRSLLVVGRWRAAAREPTSSWTVVVDKSCSATNSIPLLTPPQSRSNGSLGKSRTLPHEDSLLPQMTIVHLHPRQGFWSGRLWKAHQ